MAMHDESSALRALPRGQLGALASLLPPQARIVEPLRVLTLRCLPGGEADLASAVAAALPGPGTFAGSLVWRSPSEWLHIGNDGAAADALLHALPPGAAAAQATDLSAGIVVIELQDAALDALLSRLLDAAVPLSQPGQAARTRLAEIAVLALRLAPERLWLLADRGNAHYLAHWLAYAAAALSAPQS